MAKEKKKEKTRKKKMIPIYIMGKRYEVPETLTIMKAMEYSGHRFIRGAGCRGGMCGACGTVYRTPGDYKIKVGLACQTVVEPEMYLTQIPFYPANRAAYVIGKVSPEAETILKLYPETYRCLSCNACGRACPQDLKVMEYVQAAIRGDIKRVAELSFECIMCGLCISRCPAELVQPNIAMLCRRLYGKYMAPKAKDLQRRAEEVEKGRFDKEMDELTTMDTESLKKLYEEREIEPL